MAYSPPRQQGQITSLHEQQATEEEQSNVGNTETGSLDLLYPSEPERAILNKLRSLYNQYDDVAAAHLIIKVLQESEYLSARLYEELSLFTEQLQESSYSIEAQCLCNDIQNHFLPGFTQGLNVDLSSLTADDGPVISNKENVGSSRNSGLVGKVATAETMQENLEALKRTNAALASNLAPPGLNAA